MFFIRRQSGYVLSPAKHRLLYLVSNRYAVHVVVVIVVVAVSMMNFGGSEVRAESFGKQSMLYSLVSEGLRAYFDRKKRMFGD